MDIDVKQCSILSTIRLGEGLITILPNIVFSGAMDWRFILGKFIQNRSKINFKASHNATLNNLFSSVIYSASTEGTAPLTILNL
jgi:hypothetical protein